MRGPARLALLAAVAAMACGLAAVAEARGARRIVSLAPNVTELLFAAGAGARVVGVSEYSNHPAAAQRIARIGDAFRFDYERVLALQPDLVVAWASGTPAAAVARLRELGLNVIEVRTATLEEIGVAIGQLGREAGTMAAARPAQAAYQSRLAALRRQYGGRRALGVFIEIDDEPLYTVNGRHLISHMVELCGGRNVFADLPSLAPAVDVEAVLARNPEAILVTDDTAVAPAVAWARFGQLKAARAGTVLVVPGDLVTRATPRALAGVEAVCRALESARRRLDTVGR